MKESIIEQEVPEEEDWSGILLGDLSTGSFAQHETLVDVSLPNGKMIHIASTASLSPLDMVELSCGINDATGHRVWLGAELWIHALPKLAPYFVSPLRSICRCLELGSGTGLSGLASLHYFCEEISLDLILTDNSQSVLDLCQKNYQRNKLKNRDVGSTEQSIVRVEYLEWGDCLPDIEQRKQHIVMATDVIYDVASWKPLLETTQQSLSQDGFLLVAHVPRAALPEEDSHDATTISYLKRLETYLIRIALEYDFRLNSLLRPSDLGTFPDQEDMEEAGASILIFERNL